MELVVDIQAIRAIVEKFNHRNHAESKAEIKDATQIR